MPKRKLSDKEVNLAFTRLHGQSDEFMEMVQLKAGLRLLRDDEEISKEKLEYAETVLSTRLNNILGAMVPGVEKRPRTLRELKPKEIETDLLLKLVSEQDYIFHLLIVKDTGEKEERPISLKDMLYIAPVHPPFKWKLSSIEMIDGDEDFLFNLVFGQGMIEYRQDIAEDMLSSISTSTSTSTTITTTASAPSSLTPVPSPGVESVGPTKTGKFYIYSLWCGNCLDFTHFGLPTDATRIDPVTCSKCSRILLSPLKSMTPETPSQ